MNDGFYTPTALASDLIRLSRQSNPKRIADFAVGGGSLLLAARQTWPDAQFYGIDLNPDAILEARKVLPSLEAYTSDYLSDEVLELTSELFHEIDLIVLNPPFTCRGSSFETTLFQASEVKSSKAMAFILRACRYLRISGEILAIVPRSCLFSQKDREARKAIAASHIIEDLGTYQSPGFSKASVSVHLVRVTRRSESTPLPISPPASVEIIRPNQHYSLVFMRGSHPVADGVTKAKGPSLVHTTDLFNFEIAISRRRAVHHNKLVSGKVLMFPRVARPSIDKVAIGSFIQPVVPSDCIICVKTVPLGHEEHLHTQILLFWDALKEAYSGTCASYLTMESFKIFAAKLGFEAELTSDCRIWNPDGGSTAKEGSISTKVNS